MKVRSRPNIVFILVDDLGARDLGCFGSSFYETPVMDALAQRGMRFGRAYAAAPVCSPTRASVMTGKYPARVGITQWIGGRLKGRLADVPYLDHLPLSECALPRALQEGGYQTWHVGKWHLGGEAHYPERHGFEVNIAGRDVGHPPGPNGYWGPYSIDGFTGPEGEYLTDRLTDEAIGLIERRDESRPFYLNLWHYAVHTPIQAPAELIEKYRAKAKRLGLDQIEPMVRGERIPMQYPAGQTPGNVVRRTVQSDPVYAAMMENLDGNVGRLVETIERLGLMDNTIFVFASDNGGLSTAEGAPTCNHPLAEGKGWSYEGGNRVCQFITWPGTIAAGGVCHEPVISTDFYPTLLEAAGLPLRAGQHVDGRSLMGLLTGGGEGLGREFVFWHYPHYSNQGGRPGAAVVSGKWKLIWHFEDDRVELFDLEEDVSEARDVAGSYPAVAGRMKQALVDWQAEVEAKMPGVNAEWEGYTSTPYWSERTTPEQTG